MNTLTHKSDYLEYIFKSPSTNWTSKKRIKDMLTLVELNGTKIQSGGMPIISDGKIAYIDDSDNNCTIFGASGFKKSICAFMPLIKVLAQAGENMVTLDPKGELYKRTANLLQVHGYKIIVLNFRDYNGDGFNPLYLPAKHWKLSQTDIAEVMTNNLVSALSNKEEQSKDSDPFWPDTAKAYINGILPLMFDSYEIKDINFLSLADYFTNITANILKDFICDKAIKSNVAIANIRSVLSEPPDTRMSTLATCSSFIQPFIQNEKLCRMLSHSTFELEDIANEKTALYIITDDTTNTCNTIVGNLITQLQTVLVNKAFHSVDGRLPNRVNFILDEFCSFPIPEIGQSLATHRSRNIRYYLCIQSIDALSERYPHYEGLLTNCATTLFLGSTEMKLLENISVRLGVTEKTTSKLKEPLISVQELMTLKKDWYSKEAIYFNLAKAIRYCTTLPAIEQYDGVCQYGNSSLPDTTHPEVSVYKFSNLFLDTSIGKIKMPFSK
jgi:type IV secretory pathway TraG/TraD family ATPase VirD4